MHLLADKAACRYVLFARFEPITRDYKSLAIWMGKLLFGTVERKEERAAISHHHQPSSQPFQPVSLSPISTSRHRFPPLSADESAGDTA